MNESRQNNRFIKKHTGIKRLFYATTYSWNGLRSALKNEAAFRQEFLVFIILTVCTFLFDVTAIERIALISSLLMVLILELVNSAIECVVDRVGMDWHPLSGRAKDYGSLAVLLGLVIAAGIWIGILY